MEICALLQAQSNAHAAAVADALKPRTSQQRAKEITSMAEQERLVHEDRIAELERNVTAQATSAALKQIAASTVHTATLNACMRVLVRKMRREQGG